MTPLAHLLAYLNGKRRNPWCALGSHLYFPATHEGVVARFCARCGKRATP